MAIGRTLRLEASTNRVIRLSRRIGKTWSAFVTDRYEKIGIISVRRARSDEEVLHVLDQGAECGTLG
jgi:hypothetical protein